jgi:hypothetical protein
VVRVYCEFSELALLLPLEDSGAKGNLMKEIRIGNLSFELMKLNTYKARQKKGETALALRIRYQVYHENALIQFKPERIAQELSILIVRYHSLSSSPCLQGPFPKSTILYR